MELYILDDELRRIQVFDYFESLIWTERFSDTGDFELVIASTPETRNVFVTGTKLAVNTSYRVMEIEEVEDTTDEEGRKMLTVLGPSLEGILKNRIAKESMGDLTEDPAWVLVGTPANIARKIFKDICVDGVLDEADIIPFITEGDFLVTPGSWAALDSDLMWEDAEGDWENGYSGYTPAGVDDVDDDIIVQITPTSVFEAIQHICQAYGLGFRLVRNFDNSELYFDIYSGIDRTTLQTDLPPVIFSADLDNLSNTSEFSSIVDTKNVAYVFSNNGMEIVFSPNADISSSGFDRKVLYVDASDIEEPAGPTLTTMLQQRGREELANYRSLNAFDGEINQFGTYRYGVDFDLGDLVELKSVNNITSKMRVSEQIFIHDAEGERSYPTLVSEITITPGSWAAMNPILYWDDAEGVWADA